MRALIVIGIMLTLAASATASGASRQHSRGALILYWSDSPWPSIWSVRPDGTHRRWLYRTHQNAKRPSLSPDGTWVAFDGAPPGKPPLSDFDVQVVRLDGTGRRTLAGSPQVELDPRWAPDGSRLCFTRSPTASNWRRAYVWIVPWRGGSPWRLTRGEACRWAPDGRELVFSAPTSQSDGDLFSISSDRRGRRQLCATPELETPAAWSPDGTKILFTRFRLGRGGDVFVMNADGTRVRRLTDSRWDDMAGAWSPDGSQILFTSKRSGRWHMYVMEADGSRQRRLTRSNVNEFEPSWR